MSASNWDTLAVDLNGKPHDGGFVSPGGVHVEIYKNWIYIHDPKAWREDGQYVIDTIMEIQNGSLHYHDMQIEVIRGPQDGVYVVCWHTDYNTDDFVCTGMVGCGVYGFDDEGFIGVKSESVEFLQKWISAKERTWTDEEVADMIKDLNNPDTDLEKYERELKEGTRSTHGFPDEVSRITLESATRFNQGDKFFADRMGTDLQESAPGDAKEPTIMRLM